MKHQKFTRTLMAAVFSTAVAFGATAANAADAEFTLTYAHSAEINHRKF